MLSWSEKIALMTTKGMSWKEVQEMDKGLDEEKKNPPKDKPKDEPEDEPKDKPKDELEDEPKDKPKDEPKDEPTEAEKELLAKVEELENKLKEAQADNVHADNGDEKELSFDEQLNEMFKDYRI